MWLQLPRPLPVAALGTGTRAAARPAASPAAGASPAASRQPQFQTCTRPTPTAPAQALLQAPTLFLPSFCNPPLPSLEVSTRAPIWGGDASPSRAPRCACTLAVTCEAGEQRFRCVRGVPAQLSGYTKQAAHRLLVLYPATTTNPSLLLYKEQPAAFIARPWFLQPWPEL